MILLIDNYDSFTYNLYQCLSGLGAQVMVRRNDAISIGEAEALAPERIVLSPGPGHPANKRDFGVCRDILDEVTGIPVLGVCLGHQGIVLRFGGKVQKAAAPMHGKTSMVEHDGKGLFAGIPSPIEAMRYHSLVGTDIPDELEVTATSMDDRQVMAVRHRTLPISGVQFHPESVMTPCGGKILENFLRC
ncbi:MAG: aminodeoxychorismate/anthranilate synthase component II [Candidatus Micrarchaeota archaeon]